MQHLMRHQLRALTASAAAVAGVQVRDVYCKEAAPPAGPTFRLCSAGRGGHTPVFMANPAANMASVTVNTGLLRSYASTTGNAGRNVHDALYAATLAAALKRPGELKGLEAAGEEAKRAAEDLHLVASYARTSKPPPGPACAAFIDVLQERARPLNVRNVALVFVDAPVGQRTQRDSALRCEAVGSLAAGDLPGLPKASVFSKKEDFLAAVELTARNAMSAVIEYNRSSDANSPELPHIEALQYCVVSGTDELRHPAASKLDVAVASLRGLGAAAKEALEHAPEVYLSYDENVYAEALKILKLSPAR